MNAIVFVAVTAAWCGPCQQLHRDFDGDGRIQFVDFDADRDFVKKNRVRNVPTIIAMRDGKEVSRKVGYRGKQDLEGWMKKVSDGLSRRLRDAYADPFSTEHDPRALLMLAADEIDRLDEALDDAVRTMNACIADYAKLRALLVDGKSITEAEREALEFVVERWFVASGDDRAALKDLLERLK